MRRILIIAAALVLPVGCASSTHEQREAEIHQQRAQEAASAGDYSRSEREQRKADRERREAQHRALEEQQQGMPMPEGEPIAPPPATNPYTP